MLEQSLRRLTLLPQLFDPHIVAADFSGRGRGAVVDWRLGDVFINHFLHVTTVPGDYLYSGLLLE